ncbi:MAG: hypothetical protein QGF59_00635 [Pirellulaceae bacterium]|nr:hypothetical protein [Pirellulaceae bacterium]MDP6717119.1 hypothetical protein [Pirellulaceae bacterium]HJN09789.1 hypothetical protein [Pirellulaceae bacterium]
MANFIKCTEDRGIGKQFVFVNVDHVATARFDPETGILELGIAGVPEGVTVHSEEAKVAVKKIEGLV